MRAALDAPGEALSEPRRLGMRLFGQDVVQGGADGRDLQGVGEEGAADGKARQVAARALFQRGLDEGREFIAEPVKAGRMPPAMALPSTRMSQSRSQARLRPP